MCTRHPRIHAESNRLIPVVPQDSPQADRHQGAHLEMESHHKTRPPKGPLDQTNHTEALGLFLSAQHALRQPRSPSDPPRQDPDWVWTGPARNRMRLCERSKWESHRRAKAAHRGSGPKASNSDTGTCARHPSRARAHRDRRERMNRSETYQGQGRRSRASISRREITDGSVEEGSEIRPRPEDRSTDC